MNKSYIVTGELLDMIANAETVDERHELKVLLTLATVDKSVWSAHSISPAMGLANVARVPSGWIVPRLSELEEKARILIRPAEVNL